MRKALIIGILLLTGLPAFADTVSVNHPTAYSGPSGNTSVGASPLTGATCSITTAGDVSVHFVSNSGLSVPGGNEVASGPNCLTSGGLIMRMSSLTDSISANVPTDPQPWDYSWGQTGTYKLLIVDNTNPDANPTFDSQVGDPGILFVSPVYSIVNSEPPTPPDNSLFDSSVIMASVVASVQQTGSLLWPMFVFMGILIAFYIAERVGDFIRKSIGAKKSSSYEDEYTPEQRKRITDKIKELGDRDSFDE